MPTNGDISLEILDLENTSGFSFLGWVYTEGTFSSLNGNIQSNFNLSFPSPLNAFSVPVVMRGCGTGRMGGSGIFIENPQIDYDINSVTGQNTGWLKSPWKAQLTGFGYEKTGLIEAADVQNPYFGQQTVSLMGQDISGNPLLYNDGSRRGRLDLIRAIPTVFDQVQTVYSGLQEAWISYDLRSGVNNNNVFAYSLQMLSMISGLSGESGRTIVFDPNPSELLFWSGFTYNGLCNNVSLFLGSTGLTCILPTNDDGTQVDPNQPTIECLPTGLTSAQITAQISGILSGIIASDKSQGYFQGNPSSSIINSPVSFSYSIYQGAIAFNQPTSGDTISFYPYSYDYTGEYHQVYGVNPPFPASGFTWTYGVDYTGIDSLISKINTNLSGNNFNIWIQNDGCFNNSLSGYFETGNLVIASKFDSNTITIQSTRIGSAGDYLWTFVSVEQPNIFIPPTLNILKYMLPNQVTLQAANIYGSWTTLDTHSGISWGNVPASIITDKTYNIYSGFPTGNGGTLPTDFSSSGSIGFSLSGQAVPQLIYEAQVNGLTQCGTPFSQKIDFYLPPSGFSCQDTDPQSSGNINSQITPSGNTSQSTTDLVNYYFLKTGWKFTNTTGYNFYRILFDGLNASSNLQNIIINNSFIVNNINLYGYNTGVTLHSGNMCVIGASYTGRIQGYTTGIISGILSGFADESGLLTFNNQTVTGTPNGNNIVQFQHSLGHATQPFTGLVTQTVTGTGYFIEPIYGLFYNSLNNTLFFSENVSGFITGSGNLNGGPYAIVNSGSIQKVTSVPYQLVTGTSTALLSGIIPNFTVSLLDVPAFSYYSGILTGIIGTGDFGSISISEIITTLPTSCQSLEVSGTLQASATLNYNAPQSGDYISINNFISVYSSNTGDLPPTYFHNIGELTNIINSGQSYFDCSATNTVSKISLTSSPLGISGNVIPVSSSGSTGIPTFNSLNFTGGINYYFPLIPSSPFTGEVDATLFASGIYSGLATGYLTGMVPLLEFVRSFTGVWDISTGSIGLLNSGFSYNNFSGMPFYTNYPSIIPILVTYNNFPLVVTNDLVLLTITGVNINTGVQFLLSGQF